MPYIKRERALRTNKRQLIGIFIIGAVFVVLGSYNVLLRYKATSGAASPPMANAVVSTDTDTPSENEPKMNDAYKVPDAEPRRVIIPSINVNGFIQKVGLNNQGAVSVPTNVHFAGWLITQKAPGEQGLSIIDGHVSGRYKAGIFKNLENVKIGSYIQIEFGDLSIRKFQVLDIKKLPEAETSANLFTKRRDVEAQLNLITCGGTYDKSKRTYSDRVIVVAKLIN